MQTPSSPDSTIHDGKWLSFRTRSFRDREGTERVWEFVTRTNTDGAVLVIPIIPGPEPVLVLVKQFRPALATSILEFPAGGLNAGEAPEACALRELFEETGCRGRVIGVGPRGYSTPGMTDEYVIPVTVHVESIAEHQPEIEEHIEVMQIPLRGLREALDALAAGGLLIDGKLWFFACGLDFAAVPSTLLTGAVQP
ncbi:MAG: NUDIX hydrolase [Verrucomicrobiota bacterium]|nr:NUDIX hydrolase [Verrucomicrobiota bacterium]